MRAGITRWAAGAALGCVLAVAGTALGQTPASPDNVTEQIRQLRDLVNKQQDQINQLSHTSSLAPSLSNDQRQEILALIKDELKDQKLPDWVNNLKITGDFRFRTQWTQKGNTLANEKAVPYVYQNREETLQTIRARLGFIEQVNDEVTVGIQLITGGGTKGYGGADPISGNQTLGGGGYPGEEKIPVWFDLAYVDYHPKAVLGLDVYAGRMPNPFLEPGNSEMIWASDLRMDGMAVKYKKQVAEGLTLFGNGGGFWISEGVNNGASTSISTEEEPDSFLWAGQGYATLALPQLAKGAYATGGVSVYAYTHVQNDLTPNGATIPPGGAAAPGLPFPNGAGNSTNANGTLSSGFDIINPFVEVGVDDPWLHKRISVFGDIAYNAAARSPKVLGVPVSDGDNALAWLIGASYGTLKNPGDWQVIYNYRRVGADAVMATFDDSNAAGGGTDFHGSKLTLAYQVAKGWQAALSYFYDDVGNFSDTALPAGATGTIATNHCSPSYQRLQFDLLFSF